MPALVACDVDGTLLDDGETVTKRTRDAVHAAVDAGTHFILATGRPPRWVRPIVDALGFAPMAVCANGAVIYDPGTDRVMSVRTLPVDALATLAEVATRVIPGAGLAAMSALAAPALRISSLIAGALSRWSIDTSVLSGFSHACS